MLDQDLVRCGLLLLLLAGGCASAPASPPPAVAKTVAAPSAEPAATCSPGQPESPADLKDILRAKREDIQRCTLLGTHGSEEAVIRLNLLISDRGAIKRLDLTSALALDPTVQKCCEKSISEVTFSPFCGDDVEVHWSYEIR